MLFFQEYNVGVSASKCCVPSPGQEIDTFGNAVSLPTPGNYSPSISAIYDAFHIGTDDNLQSDQDTLAIWKFILSEQDPGREGNINAPLNDEEIAQCEVFGLSHEEYRYNMSFGKIEDSNPDLYFSTDSIESAFGRLDAQEQASSDDNDSNWFY